MHRNTFEKTVHYSSMIVKTLLEDYLSVIKLLLKMEVLSETRTQNNKENHCNEKELQRLKVELNDRIFELHKLEEDHAQQKAQIYIQLQKEKQQYKKTIKELKDKIKDDNQQWANKIQEIRAQREQNIDTLKKGIEQQLQSKFKAHIEEVKETYEKEVAELKAKMSQQIKQHRQREEQIIRESNKNLQKLTTTYKKQQQQKDKYYNKSINDLKKQYEISMSKMQSIYLSEELSKKKAETALQNSITSHIREKNTWGNTETTLNQQIVKLTQRISQLQQKIVISHKENQQICINHKSQQSFLTKKFQSQISLLTHKYQQLNQQNCQTYTSEIQSLKAQIESLLLIHKRKEQCWQQCGRKVLQLYEKRESKKQDVKAIQKLQVQLIKKDFLIQRQRKQLQNCKLEMENMEEVYDRIFIFNTNGIRSKARSYQIKKTKNSCQLNQSNRSTITEKRYGQK